MEAPQQNNQRLENMADLIVNFAQGNFDARCELTEDDDSINIIIAGLNMLGDELTHYREKILGNEMRFRTMIEYSKDGIAIMSTEGEIIYLSSNSETILGYTNEETTQSITYKNKDRFKKIFKKHLDAPGKTVRTLWKKRHKNGQWIWLDVIATNLAHNSAINGIVINYRDITKEKKAALQKEFDDNNLKSLINNTDDLMWSVDKNMRLITCNTAFEEIIRLISGEKIQKGQTVLIPAFGEEQLKRWECIYKRALAGEIFTEIEYNKEPVESWSEISFYPIRQNGFVAGAACYSRNITELKKAQILEAAHQGLIKEKELAENSKKAKEQFLANMSHEIRTPMNAIIGMTEILAESNLEQEQTECVNAIKISADNLLSIINDILDFSKIESGKITFEKQPIRLGKVLEEVIQTLHFTVNKKSVSLSYSISEDIPSILLGDIVRLRQILINLCSNAIKFTEQGSVRLDALLKTNQNDNYTVLFTVTDTGIGISKDKQRLIFESFVQASEDTTRRYGGTGLGLAITKQLVELQGGNISVKSEPNQGSQFSFTLCFEKGKEDCASDKTEEIVVFTGLEGIKVLLAEDNSMNQILAKKILNKWNLQLDIAANGKIAVEMLEKYEYDIVLMDMHMPEMDGYQATKYIRDKMSGPKSLIPIIAVTANAIMGEEEKCLAAGMNSYISKPLNKRKLYEKMQELVGKNKTIHMEEIKAQPHESRYTDLTYLIELAEGSNEFMIDMITSFISDMPQTLHNIDNAFAEKKWPELKVIAHTMKSTADFMGIHSIKETVRTIEKYAALKENNSHLPELIEKTKFACNKAVEELKIEIGHWMNP